jgi:hypothetical protein
MAVKIMGEPTAKIYVPKNGTNDKVKNLKLKAKNSAVSSIFTFAPLKNESITCFEALAPANLNAYSANTKLGIMPIQPPANADRAWLNPQPKYIIVVESKVSVEAKINCCRDNCRPGFTN